MNTLPQIEILSLPAVAARTGSSIDVLRRFAAELAAAGVIHRVGATWCCEASRAHLVPEALARVKAAKRAAAAK